MYRTAQITPFPRETNINLTSSAYCIIISNFSTFWKNHLKSFFNAVSKIYHQPPSVNVHIDLTNPLKHGMTRNQSAYISCWDSLQELRKMITIPLYSMNYTVLKLIEELNLELLCRFTTVRPIRILHNLDVNWFQPLVYLTN